MLTLIATNQPQTAAKVKSIRTKLSLMTIYVNNNKRKQQFKHKAQNLCISLCMPSTICTELNKPAVGSILVAWCN